MDFLLLGICLEFFLISAISRFGEGFNRGLIETLAGVRDNQFRIKGNRVPEAVAGGTGPIGIVK